MTVVGAGAGCVRWGYPGLLAIVASWFASPLLAGFLSAVLLIFIKKGVLEVEHIHEQHHSCILLANLLMNLEDPYTPRASPYTLIITPALLPIVYHVCTALM